MHDLKHLERKLIVEQRLFDDLDPRRISTRARFKGRMRRDQNAGRGDTGGAQARQQVQPIHAGEFLVKDQTAPLFLSRRRQRRLAVRERRHRNACRFEGEAQGVTNRRVVIDKRQQGRRSDKLIQGSMQCQLTRRGWR